MRDTIAERYVAGLAAWVVWVHRRARAVLIVALAATLASVVYFADAVRINTDTTDMLSKDLPFRQLSREISAAFPIASDNIVVVVEGKTADLADDGALALGQRLRRHPELFSDVYDLAGSEHFRRNGLLYLDIDELQNLSDRLAEAQPFLGALWRDPSLRGLFRMLGLAVDEEISSGGGAIDTSMVLNALAEVAEAQRLGEFRHLSWTRMLGGARDREEVRRFIQVKPALNFGSLQPADEAMQTIRRLAMEIGLTEGRGVRIRLTGSAALAQEELESVERGMGLAAALSLSLVLGLLFIGLRSINLVFSTLVTLLAGLAWTAAFAILVLDALNLISVAFAVLFIGLSVDFGIHFALRYREAVVDGFDQITALETAARGSGGALTLCAVSAAIAFYAFLPTDYVGLAELGLIAGTGMFVALFANLTLLPALVSVLPYRRPQRAPAPVAMADRGVRGVRLKYAGAICAVAGVLAVASAALAPATVFDFDPLNLKDPNSESMATLFDLMRDGLNSKYSSEVLASNLETAKALAEKLADLPAVDKAVTLASFLPDNQEDKLQVIGQMALFLSPAFVSGTGSAPPTAVDRRDSWSKLAVRLRTLAGAETASVAAAGAARRLGDAIGAIAVSGNAGDAALLELENRLLSGLPGRLDALDKSLAASPVTLGSLPEALRRRQIAADGRAMIEIFPKKDLRDRAALEEFVEAIRTVAPDAVGAPVVILEAGRTVIGAFAQAAVIAAVAIAVLLFLALGRLGDALLVFAPLVLAALCTVAASVVLGLAFNFANVIVLPLLFGLGVAGGIHLVARVRAEGRVEAMFETSTPRAVTFSALTTIGSFGSIALSGHPGTASMGILLTIAISLTLASTLIFLPALMSLALNRSTTADAKGGP